MNTTCPWCHLCKYVLIFSSRLQLLATIYNYLQLVYNSFATVVNELSTDVNNCRWILTRLQLFTTRLQLVCNIASSCVHCISVSCQLQLDELRKCVALVSQSHTGRRRKQRQCSSQRELMLTSVVCQCVSCLNSPMAAMHWIWVATQLELLSIVYRWAVHRFVRNSKQLGLAEYRL